MSGLSTELITPAYGVRSLADVLPAVVQALGVPGGRPGGLELPAASAYVVFLIDGLGAEQLTRYAEDAPYLASLMETPGTATVPSTTAVSLTSLGTGLAPGEHGVVGYTSRIPGTTELLNALHWPATVEPHRWQPHETVFGALADRGRAATVVGKREFFGSGLTAVSQRGAEFVAAERAGERIAGAVEASRRSGMVYLYDSDLDWTGHKHGVNSAEWLQQLAMLDAEAERLRDALPAHVRLLVVADHGMIDSPLEDRIDVDDEPVLRDGLVMLGGEARFRHLYTRSGAAEDVAATWRSILGDRAEVRTRAEATDWFGPIAEPVSARVGDVVVAATGTTAIMAAREFPKEGMLVGMHGSLTAEEMLIPVLVD